MSEHRITLRWRRSTPDLSYELYNRAHMVTFKNGHALKMSAAVSYRGDADAVDPEEAFVASLASCHMLTFLAIASRRGLTVNSYSDEAVGYMGRDSAGRMAVTRVVLRPRVALGDPQLEPRVLEELHHAAHEECFIANSVSTTVMVEPSR